MEEHSEELQVALGTEPGGTQVNNVILILERLMEHTGPSAHSRQSRLRPGKGGGREAEEKKAEESPGTGR